MTEPTVKDFFTGKSSQQPVNGNSIWASQKAHDIIDLVHRFDQTRPRSTQVHLGPSELGTECDRQVVYKLLGLPKTNHVSDPWPAIIGTSVHTWLAEAFTQDNTENRWMVEHQVTPFDDHSGTADLYDVVDKIVYDHKVVGESTLSTIKAQGPSRKYQAQLGLYALGYLRAGFPVDKVALIIYPRAASLKNLYVWERALDADLTQLVYNVIQDTRRRKDLAFLTSQNLIALDKVPKTPGKECYFCPFYRPEAIDGGPGCSGAK